MRRNLLAAAVLPAAGFAVGFLFAAAVVFPMANAAKSSRAFAGVIVAETAASRAAGQRLMAFDLGNLPVHYAFYTDGIYTVETSDPEDLARHLDQEARVWAVADAQRLGELPAEIRERMEIVATTHASRKDVALIVNRGAE